MEHAPSLPGSVFRLLAVLAPSPALANVPMFMVVSLAKFSAWWTIPFVLAIEAVAIRYLFGLDWRRAAKVSVIANVVSAAAGVFAYPFLGMALYPALYPFVTQTFGYGPMVEATATFAALAVVDSVIELVAIAVYLSRKVLRQAFLYFLANVVTAALMLGAIAYASLPPSLPLAEAEAVLADYPREAELILRVLEEAPEHAEPERFRFNEIWQEGWRAKAEGLAFRDVRIGGPQMQGWVVSTEQTLNWHGITLVGQRKVDGVKVSLFRRDRRDGGGEYWELFAARKVGDDTYSVTGYIE